MKISHLTNDGWKRIHSGTVLAHFTLSKAEIRAPFRVFWARLEAGTEMAIDMGHPECELFITTSGHGKAIVGDEECEIMEGDTIFVPPNTSHRFNNYSNEEIAIICIKYQENIQTLRHQFADTPRQQFMCDMPFVRMRLTAGKTCFFLLTKMPRFQRRSNRFF